MAIKITSEPFHGYPDGKMRAFATGEVVADLPAEYEQVLIAKGFAVAESAAPAEPPSEGAASPKKGSK